MRRYKKKKKRTSLALYSHLLFHNSETASDPWRSFVTLFPHARRLKIPRLCSLAVMRFEMVRRLFTSHNLSQEADYRTGHLSKAYLERQWRSTEVAFLREKKKKKNKRKMFPRLTLGCLILSRVHLVKPRIMSRGKEVRTVEYRFSSKATNCDSLSLIKFISYVTDIAKYHIYDWLYDNYLVLFLNTL